MSSAFDLVPDGSGHAVGDLAIDEAGHEPVFRALPEMDGPLDRGDIECPAPVEHFTIADQAGAALRKTLGTHFGKCGLDPGGVQDALVVVVGRLIELLKVGFAEAGDGDAEHPVERAETRLEMQRKIAAEGIDFWR